MSEVIQERLFEAPDDIIVEGRTLMWEFLKEETGTLDLSDENDCITAMYAILIAAEFHAQNIAKVRGDIDPEREEFLSDVVIGRINAPECDAVFTIDPDKEWRDVDRADDQTVDRMEVRAFAIAQALIHEQGLVQALSMDDRSSKKNQDDIFFAEVARRDIAKQQRAHDIANFVTKQVTQACNVVFGPIPKPDCRDLEWYEYDLNEDLFIKEIEGLPPDQQAQLATAYFIEQGFITEEELQ